MASYSSPPDSQSLNRNLHIALNGWFWTQPDTGSGQYVRHLAAWLRRVQPELRLTLIIPAGKVPDGVPDGVNVVAVKAGRSNIGKLWFEQVAFPRAVGRAGADVAHVPYWGAPLRSPAPLAVSVLDVIPLALPIYARGAAARAYVALQSAAARGAAHILTISEAAKADITQYLGIPAGGITATPLAADEVYHPQIGRERDAAVRAKYNLPERFTLYLGGFDARKNLVQLLDAYAVVHRAEGDQYPLVIAGREPEWAEPIFPDVRAQAAERGLNDVIRWIGYVDEADKPSLYRLARVFAFPSLYEGFGLPVLEAMASGTPVIANELAVMEEICGDAAYLVEPDSSREMAGALLALLGQDALHSNLSGRGVAQASNFTWRKTARATAAVYGQVARTIMRP